MKHLLTRFFTCMIVCVCCFMYTRDAMALLGEGKVTYVCAEYDDYLDYDANAVYFDWVLMSDPYTIENNVHEKCTPPSGTTFAGWLVTGWDILINGLYGGEIHQPGDVINITDVDQFLVAQYEPVGATYTVTYSCNSGTGTAPSNQTATENQSFTPASNTCTKNGYAFTGWAVSGTNDVKPAGTAFTWEYTENKTFSAQWTGNTISVNWYDGEDELTGENVAGSCTYGNTFNVPTPTPRTGYVFTGWVATIPEVEDFDLTTLDPEVPGDNYYAIGYSQYEKAEACYDTDSYENNDWGRFFTSCPDAEFSDLNRFEWKTVFDYGTIYGVSLCSETDAGWDPTTGTPTENADDEHFEPSYCWCKATRYSQNGAELPVTPSVWVGGVGGILLGSTPSYGCRENCAAVCAQGAYSDSYVRQLLFGITQ